MLRFRTRFFNRFVERGIAEGARQVVSLGAGLDMRAHYLEIDLPEKLVEAGLDPDVPTVIVWEGNTMYLPTETIFPFLRRLCDRISSFRIGFDYLAEDLQERAFERKEDLERIEAVERAMGASFPTGFADLAVFEAETPLKVLEDGPIGDLGEGYGADDIAENMASDEGLRIYRYCVLATR